jgi:hypothetical protein
MESAKILESIPLTLEPEKVMAGLRARDEAQIRSLIETAMPLIQARAFYRVAYVDERTDESVSIEGTSFRSRVLSKNLDGVGRVFLHVVTIGDQLEREVRECEDLLAKYCLDGIGNMALMGVRKHLEGHLRSRFALDGVSYMSPGSLGDWPIEAQEPLFALLGNVEGAIGVRLNKNLLMVPTKSVSGIYFPNSVNFTNCKLCPREQCEGRRAEYDEKLAREYGIFEGE